MFLLLLILHNEEYLEDVLSGLIELGIEDAVVMDTEPLNKALAYRVPIFAGVRFGLSGKSLSKFIVATTNNPNAGEELVAMLKEIDIDLEDEGVSRIITIKAESVIGKPEEIEEI